MALTARILGKNGRYNVECYAAGTNGNLPVGILPCAPEGRFLQLEWALPYSENGVSITGFDFVLAVAGVSTKPRIDAVKVIVIEDVKNGGSYQKAIVPDTYEIADYVAACCAGCDPIADVTVVEPLIFNGSCVPTIPSATSCVFEGSFYVPGLTGSNNTWTATVKGYDADGVEVAFSPATVTGTTIAGLASAAQSSWASEMGSGTFTATGSVIVWTGTAVKNLGVSITQSLV